MQATVRRRPNAFNLLFQMKLLAKMGCDPNNEAWSQSSNGQFLHFSGALELIHCVGNLEVEMWNTAAELASAYKLGRAEAGAASNLLNEIEEPIVERLTGMVK